MPPSQKREFASKKPSGNQQLQPASATAQEALAGQVSTGPQPAENMPGKPLSTACQPGGSNKKQIARRGEEIAAAYLKSKGWKILASNWRCGRWGELDLIAGDSLGLIVFVEVKTRRRDGNEYGIPSSGFDAITWRKRQKIVTSAKSYLARQRLADRPCRFDLILVRFENSTAFLNYNLYPDCEILHVEDIFAS